MKIISGVISALLISLIPSVSRADIDATIDAAFRPIAKAMSDFIFVSVNIGGAELQLIVVWLIAGAIFFTFYLGFINIRGFKHAIRIVLGKEDNDAKAPGDISHFQALATAVSGTVGVGNITHVAVAVSIGGPGAAFWLMVAGFLGMATKFVECTLGVKYRQINADGSVSGGPMFYLDQGLAKLGFPRARESHGLVLRCLHRPRFARRCRNVSGEPGVCAVRQRYRWRRQLF